ncbi:MAG: DUF4389 domain-containing protein [Chloroflexi bacterium]|nr:DUF4389 domain-containing protein [Chloroflexota bacterium]
MAEHLPNQYPARLQVDYPEHLGQLSTLLRIPFSIPIWILASLLPVAPAIFLSLVAEGAIDGDAATGIFGAAFFLPLVLMLLFRRKYPRWWFEFLLELTRLQLRIAAYFELLTDQYPSTDEEQSVLLELDYPDAEELNQFLPIVKWLLLISHCIALAVLGIIAVFVLIVAWFAILFTSRYPRGLFNYIVGVNRWYLRVSAYGFLLITDRYPPFRLGP